ncbi:thiamine pyrophosphate-binding protein [Paradesulfitobacterium ferrireducens]|uniref:thiamine pyrophosphate-binding protein n=1 Tax=Paradesulfitobacterium ferrireducens TaxID=2816476 RepID=UPI001A8CC643|nr:thiamine pyrophosphate-binding protein [Paradesulfitobacterium ferrireducens]
MAERTGADILVECLQAEGIKDVFGVIGSACIDITDAIARTPGMRFIPTAHEQGAAYAADGYARITGKPAVCLVTVGPGATNALSGVAQAYMESSPVILISGEVASTVRGKGRSNWHEIDQLEVFKPITKNTLRLERVERIPELMRQAFRTATSGRQGPVYLGVPREVQTALSDVPVPAAAAYRAAARPRADAATVVQAADLIQKAKNPLVLAGGGVIWSGAREALLKLMELLAIPGAATPSHKGIIPDDHPLGLGQLGHTGSPPAQRYAQETDLILAIGCTFSETTTDRYGYHILPKRAGIIHIDIDPEEIGKSYPVDVGIVGDARSVIEDLTRELRNRGLVPPNLSLHGRVQKVAELKKSWREQFHALTAEGEGRIRRAHVIQAVRQALDHDAIVVSEAGGTCSFTRFAFEAYHPYLIPGDFSAMGSGYCMSLGAKAAYPERQVLSISGDGAMMMVLPEILTAVENNIPSVAVVIHNNIYSNIKHKQDVLFGKRFIGVDHPYPSFAKMAREFGAWGESVEQEPELLPAIQRALASGKPAIVEVFIDPTDRVPPSKTYKRWVEERQMPVV